MSHGSRRVSPGIDPLLAQSVITTKLLPLLTPVLGEIAPLMHNIGFVELHSCRVAEGAGGMQFVRQLADIIGAPVRAGISKQAAAEVFTLTGQTFSAFPGKTTLRDWGFARDEAVRPAALSSRT